jgi:hypothetical protein
VRYVVANRPEIDVWGHRIYFDATEAASYTTELEELGLSSKRTSSLLAYPPLDLGGVVQFGPSGNPSSVLDPNLFWGNPQQGLDSVTAARVARHQSDIQLYMTYIREVLAKRLFIVGADRSAADPQMRAEGHPLRVGRRGNRTLAVLSIILAEPEHEAAAESIRRWADVFALSKLSGGWSGGESLSAGYVDRQSGTPLPTRLAGFGSQQMLPLIVQLFSAPIGSVVMVEEPEISLHPAAQVDAVKMLASAVGEGRQVILTTHSPTLLLALSEIGSMGALQPKDVAVYHFSRDEEVSTVTRLEVDDSWYVRGWIPSFSEVESRLLKRWISNVGDKIDKQT